MRTFASSEQIAAEQASFISKVYGWMCLALLATGVTAVFTANSPALVETIFGNRILFFGMLIGEVICVMYLVSVIGTISATAATMMFLMYSVLNGLTLAVIFLVYTADSIALTFFVTAGTFGVMSAYGYFTKSDLTTIGNLAGMALIGLIIASIVNWFLKSEVFYWITTYAGILIFTGLTAYDTQKIKAMNVIGNEGTGDDRKEAIMGALTLYLDFINLFLMLLRLFGRRK
jgi:FtsH-binding integral membrane protein